MRLFLALAAGALCACIASAARAEGFAVGRYEPAERCADWFVVDALDLRTRPVPSVGATLDYAHKPLAVVDAAGNERFALVRHQLVAHLGTSFVLAERVRLGGSLPIAFYQDGERAVVGGETLLPATKGALGDLRLAADVRLAGRYREPITLAAGVRAWLPLGSAGQFMSDGTARISPQLLASGEVGIFAWAARFAYAYRPGADSYAGTSLRHQLLLSGGAGVRAGRWLIGPEVFAAAAFDRFFGASSTPVDVVLGVHHSLASGLEVAAAIGGGLTSGYGSPALRALLSLEWRSPILPPPPPEGSSNDETEPIQ